jgi:hypothetical protein
MQYLATAMRVTLWMQWMVHAADSALRLHASKRSHNQFAVNDAESLECLIML